MIMLDTPNLCSLENIGTFKSYNTYGLVHVNAGCRDSVSRVT